MAKKRNWILTYHKARKCWRKQYRGILIYCGYAATKTDRDAYKAAVAEFNRRKAEIDAGIYDKEAARLQKAVDRAAKRKKPVDLRWSKTQVAPLVKRFLEHSRVKSILERSHRLD